MQHDTLRMIFEAQVEAVIDSNEAAGDLLVAAGPEIEDLFSNEIGFSTGPMVVEFTARNE